MQSSDTGGKEQLSTLRQGSGDKESQEDRQTKPGGNTVSRRTELIFESCDCVYIIGYDIVLLRASGLVVFLPRSYQEGQYSTQAQNLHYTD